MTLAGTRPPTVDEWDKYELHHRARLATKPGLTGMWQVSGRSNITDFEEVVKLDKQYISEWTMGLDELVRYTRKKTVTEALKDVPRLFNAVWFNSRYEGIQRKLSLNGVVHRDEQENPQSCNSEGFGFTYGNLPHSLAMLIICQNRKEIN